MKKSILLLGSLALSASLYAQSQGKVGINETEPKATLDIKISDANKNSSTKEGILIPRVSRQRAADMGSDVTESTLIYVDDVSNGSLTGTTSLVNEKGFYYFDSKDNRWKKVASEGGTFTRNIRSDNGAIITVKEDDYFIRLTGEPIMINLPDPKKNKGRVVCFMSEATSSTGTFNPQPVGQQQAMQASQTACFISDGIDWVNSNGY
ncbi:hypothetical protein [Ornithobacterium rhinotracheale]|uniref:hypothetical protein n=1 Tax=Ornithobacterium rhinotracheale TaxID=28251 RepID=UPI001FF23ED7|nr:hypothetical protein [Ornithobacterium rhinotracheale]MCK0199152.1 hypothetical protein [Ornithobacterium rhinotracheale]